MHCSGIGFKVEAQFCRVNRFDYLRPRRKVWFICQNVAASSKRKRPSTPTKPEGTRLAAKARKMASKLSAEEWRAHFNAAMVMIYGGADAKEATITGR